MPYLQWPHAPSLGTAQPLQYWKLALTHLDILMEIFLQHLQIRS